MEALEWMRESGTVQKRDSHTKRETQAEQSRNTHYTQSKGQHTVTNARARTHERRSRSSFCAALFSLARPPQSRTQALSERASSTQTRQQKWREEERRAQANCIPHCNRLPKGRPKKKHTLTHSLNTLRQHLETGTTLAPQVHCEFYPFFSPFPASSSFPSLPPLPPFPPPHSAHRRATSQVIHSVIQSVIEASDTVIEASC